MKHLFLILLTWCLVLSAQSQINVTNYGAVGDAVQFFVNTTSNSVLLTTSNNIVVPTNAIGDVIEIFNAGEITPLGNNSFGIYTNGYLDLIATITNIVNGTNLYINIVSSNTLNNTFATYGHDNEFAFNAAVAAIYALNNTNSILNIPTGNYLFLATNTDLTFSYYSVQLSQGGFAILGAGTNNTRLIGQGARISKHVGTGEEGYGFSNAGTNTGYIRGILFDEFTPTNFVGTNTPVVFQSINIDGGIPNVATRDNYNRGDGFGVNPVDGMGADTSHDALSATFPWTTNSLVSTGYDSSDFSITCTNVLFENWAGEVLKNPDGNTNVNIAYYVDDTFYDDRFDGCNIGQNMIITNCIFNYVIQPIEMYTKLMTLPSYFENSIITNCPGGPSIGFSRGYSNIPFFYFINNYCYFTNASQGNVFLNLNHIVNVIVTNNYFSSADSGGGDIVVVTGSDSAETHYTCQSNIFIGDNIFINPNCVFSSWDGLTTFPANDEWHSDTIIVSGNKIINANTTGTVQRGMYLTYGWTTNITISSNDFSQFNNIGTNDVYILPSLNNYSINPRFNSTLITNLIYFESIFIYVSNSITITNDVLPTNGIFTITSTNNIPINYPITSTNNLYWSQINDTSYGSTNYVSYGFGSKFYQINVQPIVLINNDSNSIPVGAQISLFNDSASPIQVYLNSPSGTQTTLTNGVAASFNWNTNNSWALLGPIPPPSIIYYLPFKF